MLYSLDKTYLELNKVRYILEYYNSNNGLIYAKQITGFVNDVSLREQEGKLMRSLVVDGRVVELPVSVSSFEKIPSGQYSYVNVAIDLEDSSVRVGDWKIEDHVEHIDCDVRRLILALLSNQVDGDKIIQGLNALDFKVDGMKLTRSYLGGWIYRYNGGLDYLSSMIGQLIEQTAE